MLPFLLDPVEDFPAESIVARRRERKRTGGEESEGEGVRWGEGERGGWGLWEEGTALLYRRCRFALKFNIVYSPLDSNGEGLNCVDDDDDDVGFAQKSLLTCKSGDLFFSFFLPFSHTKTSKCLHRLKKPLFGFLATRLNT